MGGIGFFCHISYNPVLLVLLDLIGIDRSALVEAVRSQRPLNQR